MEEKNQERWDIWSIYFFTSLSFSAPYAKELWRQERRWQYISDLTSWKNLWNVSIQAAMRYYKFLNLKTDSLSNWNNFRPQQQNMHCNSMWSPITSPRRRNQQTYKFLACSKFQWIGVRWRSSQQKKICLNYCDLYTIEIWKGMCISVSFIFSYMMQNLWFK